MISATIFHDGKPMAFLKIGPGRKETDLRVVCADFFAENDLHLPCGRMNSADFPWPSAPDVHPRDVLAILATGLNRLYGTRPKESGSEKPVYQVALEKRWQEMEERENRLHEEGSADLRPASRILGDKQPDPWVALDRRMQELDKREKSLQECEQQEANKKINEEVDSRLRAGEGLPSDLEVAACKALGKRNLDLDKREAELVEREKKLTADIENLRKSHPEDRAGT